MTALNDFRLIATQVDRIFNCGQPTVLGPCVFPAFHADDCIGLPPVVEVCQLCLGRTRVPGTDHTCPHCDGAGVEPDTA